MADVTRRDVLKGAAAATVAALAPASAALAQTTQKRELVVGQGGDISKFDPHFSTSSNDIRISFNIFDNLVARWPDGKLHPALATDWKLTAPTAWTFRIRQGVKWHNGDPFSAADAKFSLERTWDPAVKTRVSTVFTTIDRVEAPNATTLVIHTKKPDPLLPARLAFYGGQIVPQKYVSAVGGDAFNAKPVGTGPVKFASWTKDDRIVLEANADYWGGKPDFDRMIVRAVPEMAPRVAALLKGEVDMITQLPPDQGERVKRRSAEPQQPQRSSATPCCSSSKRSNSPSRWRASRSLARAAWDSGTCSRTPPSACDSGQADHTWCSEWSRAGMPSLSSRPRAMWASSGLVKASMVTKAGTVPPGAARATGCGCGHCASAGRAVAGSGYRRGFTSCRVG